MPCLVILLLLGFPRLALVLLWLFGSGYLARAYESGLLAVLGFFFMPVTTITFAYAHNSLGGAGVVNELGWLLTGVAVLIDLGLFGGSGRAAKKRK